MRLLAHCGYHYLPTVPSPLARRGKLLPVPLHLPPLRYCHLPALPLARLLCCHRFVTVALVVLPSLFHRRLRHCGDVFWLSSLDHYGVLPPCRLLACLLRCHRFVTIGFPTNGARPPYCHRLAAFPPCHSPTALPSLCHYRLSH